MARLVSILLSVAALSLVTTAGHAARDGWAGWFGSGTSLSTPAPTSTLELLVFEVEGCAYCDVLRRDVLPRYKAAPASARAPMRFVDINQVDTDKLALSSPLRMVPTIVLMRDGREVERVSGYVGPEMFFKMINHMLDQID
jgi:thioredoxin-related protein